VTIHGVDQLLQPEGGALHLHFVRLEAVPGGGDSVPGLIDQLLSAGAPPGDLFDAVAAAGLAPADYNAADRIRFVIRERLTVPIDDASPRIVPLSFVGAGPPPGVVDISYRIDIDRTRDRLLSDDAYADLIRDIAARGDA
jgi:hypothetical protein